jgi:hypothetical protein
MPLLLAGSSVAPMVIKSGEKPDRETVLRLAGRANVDPKTATAFLRGCPNGRPRGALRDVCVNACKELGIVVPGEKKGGGK